MAWKRAFEPVAERGAGRDDLCGVPSSSSVPCQDATRSTCDAYLHSRIALVVAEISHTVSAKSCVEAGYNRSRSKVEDDNIWIGDIAYSLGAARGTRWDVQPEMSRELYSRDVERIQDCIRVVVALSKD